MKRGNGRGSNRNAKEGSDTGDETCNTSDQYLLAARICSSHPDDQACRRNDSIIRSEYCGSKPSNAICSVKFWVWQTHGEGLVIAKK